MTHFSNNRGSVFVAVFVVLFLAATTAFIFYFMHWRPKPVPEAPDATQDAKLAKIEEDIGRLYLSLGEAEMIGDRHGYMKIAGEAAQKLVEADALWEDSMKAENGLMQGAMGGLNGNYEAHFTREDKFAMLSEKYGLPAERVRDFKADVEIIFSEELSEKFAPAPMPEAPSEEEAKKA